MQSTLRRSWVEIDLGQIERNYKILRNYNSNYKPIMAVVKADAYGHGDLEIAKRLESVGINNFAVSNLEEACKLRKGGIKGQILILGYTPVEYASYLYKYDITQTIIDDNYAHELFDIKEPIKYQVALDTGMHRIGIPTDDELECERLIRSYAHNLNVVGIFTHMCVADSFDEENRLYTKQQINKFENIIKKISDLKLSYIHCMNSATFLWHTCRCDTISRLGIILYGLKPSYENDLPEGVKPVLKWKSVVSMTKCVGVNETIGYGRTFHVKKNMQIAIVSTGYADGYNRFLSNKGYVLINGKRAPIIGNVCMDQFMVDITKIVGVKMGTEVILLGDSITADEMAQMVGTIGYEIVCNISKRVPRIYIY